MTPTDEVTGARIADLLARQPLAVLATQGDGQPYTSLMAYAFSEDLRFILFATSSSTRKYMNIREEPRVALLVDDRSNNEEDFENAAALTILGKVDEIDVGEKKRYGELYLQRHPSLETFLASPSTLFMKIAVRSYLLVSRFEEVIEYHPGTHSGQPE